MPAGLWFHQHSELERSGDSSMRGGLPGVLPPIFLQVSRAHPAAALTVIFAVSLQFGVPIFSDIGTVA